MDRLTRRADRHARPKAVSALPGRLRIMAAAAGLPMSQFVRQLVLEALKRAKKK
jgi:hypothetical protein